MQIALRVEGFRCTLDPGLAASTRCPMWNASMPTPTAAPGRRRSSSGAAAEPPSTCPTLGPRQCQGLPAVILPLTFRDPRAETRDRSDRQPLGRARPSAPRAYRILFAATRAVGAHAAARGESRSARSQWPVRTGRSQAVGPPNAARACLHLRAGSQTVFRGLRLRQLSLSGSLSLSLIRDRSTGSMIGCHACNRRLAVWPEH
jgi:hypothetical protein